MRPAQYFDRRTGRELSAMEALSDGVLKDGVSMRVRMTARDGAPRFSDARSYWDQHRPGFRVLDNNLGRQAIADAHAAYVHDLENAYKTATMRGSGDESDALPQGELEQLTTATSDRRTVDVDAIAANHRHNMQRLYDAYARELSEAWRKR
jgi:hypothetical protein